MIAATRHEDGTFTSPDVLEWHRQRGRLLHTLDDVDGARQVEYDDAVADPNPRETGYALIDRTSRPDLTCASWLRLSPFDHRHLDACVDRRAARAVESDNQVPANLLDAETRAR